MHQDRYTGCLLAGAAGDALGYAVEFTGESAIFKRYGKDGIQDFELQHGLARISDDTQMTMFTLDGLLRSEAHSAGGDPDKTRDWIHKSYLDWLFTQRSSPSYRPSLEGKHSWLLTCDGLFIAQAPGITCLNALESGKIGAVDVPINSSCGCGGVMRTAPAGLYGCAKGLDDETICRLGAEAAAITHGHPLGYLPAAHLAVMVAELIREDLSLQESARRSLAVVCSVYADKEHIDDYKQLVQKAVWLSDNSEEPLRAIHSLGEGWTGHEAMAIALYCALRFPDDPSKVLCVSVNHKGDSDSTGAIAGNIIGAHLGAGSLPGRFLENLEHRELLEQLASDLCPENWGTAQWLERYADRI